MGSGLLVVLVHRVLPLGDPRLPVARIDEGDVLIDVDLLRERWDFGTRREDRLERGEGRGVEGLGELDGEVDEEVSKVVVSVRRHALPWDDLDGA